MKYSKNFLEGLYRTMLRIRLCEESLVKPIIDGEARCPVHLCSGQEAVAAGVCAALSQDDYVFGTHRSHGHYLAKGGDMAAMVAEIMGKESGCSGGRGGSMHLIDPVNGVVGAAPIVAGTISLAVGAALSSSIRMDGRVTVSFFGDGATGEGVLYESINFASLRNLPIIFACENNLYATHMPIMECRKRNNIHDTGHPFCIDNRRVDGNDVLAVYESAKTAVRSCRNGKGPVFLEFMTYRLRGHVGPDDNIQGSHTDIRPRSEIALWKKNDPIAKFEQFLSDNSLTDGKKMKDIARQTEKEVEEAHRFARTSPYPATEEVTKYVFKG